MHAKTQCMQRHGVVFEDNTPQLKRRHDYYYQVIGQLGITGARYCDFIVWTLVDVDTELWQEMIDKLLPHRTS